MKEDKKKYTESKINRKRLIMNNKKSVSREKASKCHPVAHDPILQDKIDKLCSDPNEYYVDHELHKQRESLEYLLRQERALGNEIVRAKSTVYALEVALNAIKKEIK